MLCTVKLIIRVGKVKVKESRNRPGVTKRVPEGLGSQIHDIRHVKVVKLSASRTGRLHPQEMFLVLLGCFKILCVFVWRPCRGKSPIMGSFFLKTAIELSKKS